MLQSLHVNKRVQLVLGLVTGILFGFVLQKSGVTTYDVILNQLLLADFTVVKVMLSAVVVGMVGVHLLRSLGVVRLHPKPGSVGKTIVGGLLFGVGFAVLGYCPGTISGAIGQGSLDALIGGTVGITLGSWLFAVSYVKLQKPILSKGDFGDLTLPELFKVNAWVVVIPAVVLIVGLLAALEHFGL